MEKDELLAELLQALINDVQELKKGVAKLPTQGAADHRAEIERLTQAVKQSGQQAGAVDLTGIMSQLDSIEQTIRYKTDYRLSRYAKFACISYGVMVALLAGSIWYTLELKGQRDEYLVDNWKMRYVRQNATAYYNQIDGYFKKEPENIKKWVVEYEEADRKREMAREAADRANELSNQAKELEGKGKKKN